MALQPFYMPATYSWNTTFSMPSWVYERVVRPVVAYVQPLSRIESARAHLRVLLSKPAWSREPAPTVSDAAQIARAVCTAREHRLRPGMRRRARIAYS